jgi:hypothetical protein
MAALTFLENKTVVIHEHSRVVSNRGTDYMVRVCAQERADGTWEGWLEFHPSDSAKPVLNTEAETSQPTRSAIDYWALGLEPVYLEGALARAQGWLL